MLDLDKARQQNNQRDRRKSIECNQINFNSQKLTELNRIITDAISTDCELNEWK